MVKEHFEKHSTADLCVLGETILLQEAEGKNGALVVGRRRRKADDAWHCGLWLGRDEQAFEHMVGT